MHRGMMGWSAFAALLLQCLPSLAECRVTGPKWYLHTNDKVTLKAEMDSQGCGHSFGVAGTWRMEKLVALKPPANGSLRQIGEVTYYYIPKLGFRGDDNYVIYICGKDTWGSGCARLNFEATVR
ncbi:MULTISPECIES: hypothetical protein [Bosea]|jgi:hypothetical protein|uniref:Secreted protein n=1 Tax=Bosea rubneri TaxID=3075434 RepID=A0ABU3SCN3_9HYPH|nr:MULTISPECIES: hypothetical protein [unclassified Bosea (in: a-proteobacteria)]MDU0342535.1 hypothetical protein [Bosea sp. ZW T0_25]HEV7335402.1 hypothetical protein [Bosea sp. (in: a-proteobacteria)]